MQKLAKRIGRNHALALALWKTGNYEARMVAIYVAELEKLTPALMDAWCRDFDNWATCDTACFKLFDRTPHAYRKVTDWAKRENEFEKRAAFALLASLALHDKSAGDEVFTRFVPLIESAASDERKKFCEEVCELGHACHRWTQCGPSGQDRGAGPEAGGFNGRHVALGGERRAPGVQGQEG